MLAMTNLLYSRTCIAMSTRLKKYIEQRLKDPKAISSVECDLLTTVDKFKINGKIKVVYIEEDRYEIYSAEINTQVNPVRISISSNIIEGNHQLKNVFESSAESRKQRDSLFSYEPSNGLLIFDEYFKQYCGLESILDAIDSFLTDAEIQKDDHIIIGESFFMEKALLYMMEQRSAGVRFSAYNGEELTTLRRIEINSKVAMEKTGLTFPMNTVLGLIQNRKDIYIPLDESTLDSEFCNGVSWRKLIGNLAEEYGSDVVINGIRCRLLRLNPYVDGFGDVFIDIWSPLDRKQRHVLVAGIGYDRQFGLADSSTEEIVSSTETIGKISEEVPESKRQVFSRSQPKANPRVKQDKKEDSNSQSSEENKPPKSDSKKIGKYRHQPLLSTDTIILLDGTEFFWKRIDDQIPSMSLKELDKTFVTIDKVFKVLASSSRIVTDTNLWVTSSPEKPREMAYEEVIDHLRRRKDRNKDMVFEVISEVYDEINKLDKLKVAAAHKAKDFIHAYQRMDLLDTPNLTSVVNLKAYADEPIGNRVLQLYEEGVNFSILTNDTDASIRWRSELKRMKNDLNRQTLPNMILCRELLTLFRMRGKIISHRKQMESGKQ